MSREQRDPLIFRITHVDNLTARPGSVGGVLPAAYGVRRPTKDIDLAAYGIPNTVDDVLQLVKSLIDS